MNQRELSSKLEELASALDGAVESDSSDWFRTVREVSVELRKLSNENYAPGNSTTWEAIKPKPTIKKSGGFISNTGKKFPF